MEWGICGLKVCRNKIKMRWIYCFYIVTLIVASGIFMVFEVPVYYIVISFFSLAVLFSLTVRMQMIRFIKKIESAMDEIMDKGSVDYTMLTFEDDLFSKLLQKIWRISEIQKETRISVEKEKKEIQVIISDIVHQIKTPMTNVLVYQEILERSLAGNSQAIETLGIIKSQFEKLEFLLQSLVKLSELESGLICLNKERTTLSACLKMALETIIYKAQKKGIQIDVHDKIDEIVYCDIRWTAEAIFNILDNAVKYSPKCGKIDISSNNLGIYACIIIKDNGIGIDRSNFTNIYKRFFRENKDSKAEGLGLGLSLTREIIMKQKGYITVNSEEGDGAEFAICLPRFEHMTNEKDEKM